MPYRTTEGEEKEKGAENLFEEIIVVHLLNWGKEKNPDNLGTEIPTPPPPAIHPRRSTPRYTVIKVGKEMIENFKSSRRKQLRTKETT